MKTLAQLSQNFNSEHRTLMLSKKIDDSAVIYIKFIFHNFRKLFITCNLINNLVLYLSG